MKRFLIVGVMALSLSGCGNSGQLSDDVAKLKQENEDLKARVTVLEGKVEAITATLPENDTPADDSQSSAAN